MNFNISLILGVFCFSTMALSTELKSCVKKTDDDVKDKYRAMWKAVRLSESIREIKPDKQIKQQHQQANINSTSNFFGKDASTDVVDRRMYTARIISSVNNDVTLSQEPKVNGRKKIVVQCAKLK